MLICIVNLLPGQLVEQVPVRNSLGKLGPEIPEQQSMLKVGI
jgi:hypothetical protein